MFLSSSRSRFDSWAWLRLLLRRSTDVCTETTPGHSGACADMTRWKKAFLLQWKWAELSGIRAGPNTQVQSETRCGGGRRLVLMDELAKTAEHKGSLLHSLTWRKNRRDACVHLPVNRQRLAAGGICPQSAFCLKWDYGSSKHAPLHPIVQLCYPRATPARSLPSPRWRTWAFPSAARSSCKEAGPVD